MLLLVIFPIRNLAAIINSMEKFTTSVEIVGEITLLVPLSPRLTPSSKAKVPRVFHEHQKQLILNF